MLDFTWTFYIIIIVVVFTPTVPYLNPLGSEG